MGNTLDEIEDTDVRAAFAGYRDDPGGGIRVDTAAIAGAGRRRVRRHRVLSGAACTVAVVSLLGGAATVPKLLGTDDQGSDDQGSVVVAADKPTELPATGRDVAVLFARADLDQPAVKTDAAARKLGLALAAQLDTLPGYLDAASSPAAGVDGVNRWALLTWADGQKAAEGLLTTVGQPIYTMQYPPPFTVCQDAERATRSCEVREVADKGWLKVFRNAPGKPAELVVSLQRTGAELVTFTVAPGAATKAGLADDRTDMGTLPVAEKDAIDAVLALPPAGT